MKKLVIRFNSPVVLCFALLSLLALLLGDVTGGAATTRFFCVYRSSLADPLTYLRLFTHVLGHAGYSHYMGNMLLLLLVGPPLEEKYGSRTLLLTIAVTALVTGLVQFIFFPQTALLGASGVVFMMIVLSSFTEMKKGGIPITLILVVVFYLGGMFYCTVELLWRQWTHGSMFLLGGLCFWTVSSLGRRVRMPLLAQMALGACIVTFFEFWTGVLVNRVMHLGVWDYSAAPFNLLGQICLPFTLLWFPLCGIGILLDRGMRRALFGTPAPQLRWV